MDLKDWISFGIDNGLVKLEVSEQVTFREAYRKWFLMKLRTIRSQSCDRIECTYIRYYAGSILEDSYVSDINEQQLVRFFTDITGMGGMTSKEFSRVLQIARSVMEYARDMDIGGARLLDWSRIRRYIPEGSIIPSGQQFYAVPRADVEKLLDMVVHQNVYPDKRSASLCLVLNFFLGLRVGELASLAWSDVDIKERVVRIYKTEVKTYGRDEYGNRSGKMTYSVVESLKTVSSFREVPLLPEAVYLIEKLRQHHRQCRYKSPYLAYDGTDTILVRSLERTLRRLCNLCEVTRFSTHSIRKTFGSMLHIAGMPTRYISDLLGHSDIRVTETHYILTYQNRRAEYLQYMEQGLSFRLDGS